MKEYQVCALRLVLRTLLLLLLASPASASTQQRSPRHGAALLHSRAAAAKDFPTPLREASGRGLIYIIVYMLDMEGWGKGGTTISAPAHSACDCGHRLQGSPSSVRAGQAAGTWKRAAPCSDMHPRCMPKHGHCHAFGALPPCPQAWVPKPPSGHGPVPWLALSPCIHGLGTMGMGSSVVEGSP